MSPRSADPGVRGGSDRVGSARPVARWSGLRAVALFFVLAYTISWAWTIPLAANRLVVHRGQGWPTHYPALLGPLIAAVTVTALTAGRAGVRDLASRTVRWRVPIRWWLVAVSPVLFLLLALAGLRAAGRVLPPPAAFGRFSGTPLLGVVGVALMITLVGSLGEEVGWRGYALPQLQRRYGPLTATLILAALWYCWHLPQFFVVQSYREFGPIDYVGMFLGLGCGAVVLTWLYNRSGGSVLLAVVWHGVYNVVGATQAAATTAIAAIVSTLIIVQGIALLAVELRARHRGRPSVLGPPPDPRRPG
jgi:uncharacterized protein